LRAAHPWLAGKSGSLRRKDEGARRKTAADSHAGSSSLKFAEFNSKPALTRTFSGVIDRIGSSNASFMLIVCRKL
jgi:hypothetical protein